MRTKLSAAGCFLGLALAAGATSTHFVSPDGQHVSPFTNMDDAATNLASAVAVAPSGGTVIVDRGHYYATQDISISQSMLTITSLYGAAETVYDGGGQSLYGIRSLSGATVHLFGLTLTNFYHDSSTSERFAISSAAGSTLHLDSCVITGNTGWPGGGANIYGTFYARQTVFRANKSMRPGTAWGGGGAIWAGSSVGVMEDCEITDNISVDSSIGGLRLEGDWTFRNCLLARNEGSALYMRSGTCYLENCIFTDNKAASGGGINISGGITLEIRNSLITRNTTTGHGGGIYSSSANVHMYNCTIVENESESGSSAGGVQLQNWAKGIAVNSVVFHNTPINLWANHNIYGTATAYLTNCIVSPIPPGSGDAFVYVTDCIDADPLLDTEFKPRRGSPAIDAGLNQDWMLDAVDLAGNPRICGGIIDIGAYEYVPVPTVIMVR